ncbi:helix-turn-helix domain-containing protein [Salmonella enterica subsp. enterica serovar Anatum]|nr:helix-turn-helix domain-containing protein [Salmonella enterica subsp. enterica serovar Anatum]
MNSIRCVKTVWIIVSARRRLTNALNRRWPKGEKLIAEALGIAPEQIWPSRYR